MIRERPEQSNRAETRIEILSNLSLSLDRLAGVFLLLSAVTLLVALLPTLMGYWPIMAIALIHLAAVGWCFRLAWRGHWARQDITVDADRVRVETRTARELRASEWPAGWVRVEQRSVRGEPRIWLGLHGERVEIGRFVPPQERIEAAMSITRALEPHSAWSQNTLQSRASSE